MQHWLASTQFSSCSARVQQFRFLAGGRHMAQSQNKHLMVLIKGHPGVGKSTLARQLCQQLQWPLIDKDDTRDCLQALPLAALQLFDANRLSYEVMFRHAAAQLSLGLCTVVDCPFARVELYDQAAQIAQQHGAEMLVIDCVAGDEAQWQRQVESRAAQKAAGDTAHKPQSWQDIQQLLDRYKGCWKWSLDGSRHLQHYLLVDTTAHPQEANLKTIVDFICSVAGPAQSQLRRSIQSSLLVDGKHSGDA